MPVPSCKGRIMARAHVKYDIVGIVREYSTSMPLTALLRCRRI